MPYALLSIDILTTEATRPQLPRANALFYIDPDAGRRPSLSLVWSYSYVFMLAPHVQGIDGLQTSAGRCVFSFTSMRLVAALSAILLITTQVVLSQLPNSLDVNFTTPSQCGQFNVSFAGSVAPVFPLSLTVVPFEANPLTLRVPDNSWNSATNSGSIHVTFLPFLEGTEFVASLDDGNGRSAGPVSDVIAIKGSNSTSCILPEGNTNFYNIEGNLTQCSHFNVTFDPEKIQNRPSIRAFLPRVISFPLNATNSPLQNLTIDAGSHSSKAHSNDSRKDSGDGSTSSKSSDGTSSSTSTTSSAATGDSSTTSTTSTTTSRASKKTSTGSRTESHARNITFQDYILDVIHGFQVVMLFDDGEGHRETSKLFTVAGDASSSHGCVANDLTTPPPFSSSGDDTSSTEKIPK